MKRIIALLLILISVAGAAVWTPPHSVTLTWHYDPPPGVTLRAFQVFRSSDGLTFARIAAGIKVYTFRDAKVTAGATYYYYVAAVDATGHLTPSNVQTAIVPK